MGTEKILKKIKQYTISNYYKINKSDMILGESFYNHMCHYNSVQKVAEGKADKVYLCMEIDEDDNFICVHFINKKGNKYIDNTLGWRYEYIDYYIIREVDGSEYRNIGNLLDNTKKFLFNTYATWFDKYILRIKYRIV